MTKKYISVGVIVAVLVVALYACWTLLLPKDKSLLTDAGNLGVNPTVARDSSSISSIDGSSNGPTITVKEIHSELAVDLENAQKLVGASHNVFIGKIVRQIGSRPSSLIPVITQFAVEVVSSIKGDLQGTVTVEQAGGYKDGVLYVTYGGDLVRRNNEATGYMLQPGSTYLLAVRYVNDGVYYLWAYPTANKLLSQNGSLSKIQLQALAGNDSRVDELEAAYPHEILYERDIRMNNMRNSYQSLTEAQKAALPYYVPPQPAPTPTSTTQGQQRKRILL